MENMKCFECALKHTATALSYGKEILNGHGEGADLDHRPDFLGELTNLEHHLRLLDENLLYEVKNYRETIQAKSIHITEDDLDYLRELYKKIEAIQKGQRTTTKIETSINSIPAVLFLNISDKNYFDLCYRKLKENLTDYSKIYFLNSSIDLTGYDVEKIDYKDIKEDYIYIINERTVILKPISAKALLRIADFKADFNYKDVIQLLKKNQPYYFYENYPVVVNKSDFWEFLDKDAPLTFYCNKYKAEYEYKVFQVAMKLDKVLCCSNKQKVQTSIYCYLENETALNSLKENLKI